MQNIAVLTSGGDAQGMNACIRAVVRMGIAENLRVYGVMDGFNGMVDGDIKELEYADVSNIIQRGGTILGTARSERFHKKEFRKIAFENLKKIGVEALVVIGGDGSFKGAKVFSEEFNMPFIGIPGTIDNDIIGTDYTLGFDTALNNIINAIDKIRDTASAHHRIFLVEVMGNTSGLLAINAALTTGAEDVFIPEALEDFARFESKIKKAVAAKKSSIIIVSEGDEIGGAKELYNYLKEKNLHEKIRVTILGHIQRGGAPSFLDRKMGTDFGVVAVQKILQEKYNLILGIQNNQMITYTLGDKITKNVSNQAEVLKIMHKLNVF
ncbi:6-phosphofructokinase [Putridiphycobacter roseus]|uniref:ATP-dependent 6-phosphofructokinase n=1 Tax=Putridiphycobacter roseus TaxID=2219161 RepID=A0A2W1NII4_9FLAO|nr:6-phosphofructokinase [Putridiphycobacter roseus]